MIEGSKPVNDLPHAVYAANRNHMLWHHACHCEAAHVVCSLGNQFRSSNNDVLFMAGLAGKAIVVLFRQSAGIGMCRSETSTPVE